MVQTGHQCRIRLSITRRAFPSLRSMLRRLYQLDIGFQAQYAVHRAASRCPEPDHLADLVRIKAVANLDLYFEAVEILYAAIAVGPELFHFEDDTLDLGREDVDTPYYEHIVAAAYDAAHTHVGTSARAWFIGQRTEVFGPVGAAAIPLWSAS